MTLPPVFQPLDPDHVRRQFPALAGEWIFFDNAGGSQILGSVADRMRDYLLTTNVQHGGGYELSRRAAERVAEGTRAAAELVGAGDPREVVLGGSATQLLSNLALALRGTLLAPGDKVVVSQAEHAANQGPWQRLGGHGVTVRTWPLDPGTRELTLAGLEPLMGPRTRLVCFTHCSNVLGALVPVQEITRFAHDRGARVVVDGVAYASHRLVDVTAWDVDFYVASLYKIYGPHQSLLWGKLEHLEALANLNHEFLAGEIPYKLQPGGVSYEAAASLPALVDYLLELGRRALGEPEASGNGKGAAPGAEARRRLLTAAFAAVADHEEALSERLLTFLRNRPGVEIVGLAEADRERRVPTVSFKTAGVDSAAVADRAARARIGLRHGHFYAKGLVESLGLADGGGVVRVSMVHYNTVEEVDRLIGVLEEVL